MDDEDEYGSNKLRVSDVAVIASTLAFRIARDIAQAFDKFDDLVRAHANYKLDQDRFREDAALEIERMTNGE